jgi:hypothetical protein
MSFIVFEKERVFSKNPSDYVKKTLYRRVVK